MEGAAGANNVSAAGAERHPRERSTEEKMVTSGECRFFADVYATRKMIRAEIGDKRNLDGAIQLRFR